MPTVYMYNYIRYDSEAEAQAAVAQKKNRLDNNPTDYAVVKELQENEDGTFLVNPTPLTDSEINNLDVAKKYLTCSVQGRDNAMPLSSSEVADKLIDYKREYATWASLGKIIKFDVSDDGTPSNKEFITPNVDMSGVV